jgi:hypothetical protein
MYKEYCFLVYGCSVHPEIQTNLDMFEWPDKAEY